MQKKPGTAERLKFSYEDIGGLGHEIQRIREMIELPLKRPGSIRNDWGSMPQKGC